MTDIYGLLGWLMSGVGFWNVSMISNVILQSMMSPDEAEGWADKVSGPLGGLVVIILMCFFFFYMWNRAHNARIELLEESIKEHKNMVSDRDKTITDLQNKLIK